jgi:hypothetical protein
MTIGGITTDGLAATTPIYRHLGRRCERTKSHPRAWCGDTQRTLNNNASDRHRIRHGRNGPAADPGGP